MAPGVIEEAVLLHAFALKLFAVGYGMIVSIPVVAGAYPVTPVGSPLKPTVITSVVATPVAETVTTEAHAPDAMADVPRAAVPEAIVLTSDELSERLVDAGCPFVITPAAVMPVRKLFVAPVSDRTVVLTAPASSLQICVFEVES